jgi:hypothetical protein
LTGVNAPLPFVRHRKATATGALPCGPSLRPSRPSPSSPPGARCYGVRRAIAPTGPG